MDMESLTEYPCASSLPCAPQRAQATTLLTWEEAVDGATVDSAPCAAEILLLSLLFVYVHGHETVRTWTRTVLQYRRTYKQCSAATFAAPWRRDGHITQQLKEAAKRKSDEVMDMVGGAMARFSGAGRVPRPVARTALNKYLDTWLLCTVRAARRTSRARMQNWTERPSQWLYFWSKRRVPTRALWRRF